MKNNFIWKYKKLFDLGWGKEHGFYMVPLLSRDQLLELTLDFKDNNKKGISDDKFNFYGALSVLIDDLLIINY